MPKTYQGTVTIVKALGFRYLWIDSLCIVRDSGDNRRTECAQMDKIYADAVLTTAADGPDASSGFLSSRQLDSVNQISLRFYDEL